MLLQIDFESPTNAQLYVLDCCLTQFLVLTVTILDWRSCMSLIDFFLYPDNALLADLVSAAIGLTVAGILFALDVQLARVVLIIFTTFNCFNGYIALHLEFGNKSSVIRLP